MLYKPQGEMCHLQEGSPRGSYYRRTQDNTTCGREGALLCSSFSRRYERVNAIWLTTPKEKIQQHKEKIDDAAKTSKSRKIHARYDKVHRLDVLQEAWRRVRANKGAAGIDGETMADIAKIGEDRFIAYGQK